MKKIISKCPSCKGDLQISTLLCPDCGMELKNNFELSIFEKLDVEQYNFLLAFLKNRGNLKEVQIDMGLSYPTVKKNLDELLVALGLKEAEIKDSVKELDISKLNADYSSNKASEIIKAKIKDNGGHVIVYTARELPCHIYAEADGKTFSSDKLQTVTYEYAVFDVIVELLLKQGGRARKGNGRNYKFGDSACDETTVVGAIAKYNGSEIGDSVYDPVFVIAAILEWAGIAENGRGELIISNEYRGKL